MAGCSLDHTIGVHAIAYNGTVEEATNSVLLLNVLRARDQAPLHFSTVGAIHGAFNLSAGLGYDLTSVNSGVQPALLAASTPSFDIGPLDRQEFARGLLRPIDSALLRLLSDQGLPDEVLLHLLVARFDEGPGGRAVPNDPMLRRPLDATARLACAAAGAAAAAPCDPFQAMVDRYTSYGRLQFNGYTRLIPLGPRLTQADATKPALLAVVREAGTTLRQDGPGWRVYRSVDQLALCVALPGGRYQAYALDSSGPQVSPILPEGDPCSADEVADHTSRAGRAAVAGFGWYLRSVAELLAFLGAVQRAEEAGVRYAVGPPGGPQPRLFRLWAEPPPRARMSVEYGGRRWWVAAYDPAEDLTLRVLALASQLLNLQKSAGEIPSTGTLRLVR